MKVITLLLAASTAAVSFAAVPAARAADVTEEAPASYAAPVVDDKGNWGFEVGAIGLTKPKYEGSSQYRFLGFPIVIPHYYGDNYDPKTRSRFSFRGLDDVRYAVLRYGDLDIGPLAGYTFGRDDSDGARLKGLGDVDGGVILGGFAEYHFDPFFVDVALGDQITGDASGAYTVKAGVGADFAVTDRLVLSPYLSATYASGDYMDKYFSVTSAQSARSDAGLDRFDADAGIKDISFQIEGKYRLSKRWSARSTLGYSRLVGDAADSPVTADADQFSALVGLTYTFGRTD
ncbi:MipA/OmpV family protein [Pararhizobium mangrovi]|uniref:MipA/OmpV family protein n=1 Tax=Pararhizobium mangrovi TaxID=2590452 RepID=UPI001F2E612F|nr:MipA/OmpV family protein [Pararhizobium mangrovi]